MAIARRASITGPNCTPILLSPSGPRRVGACKAHTLPFTLNGSAHPLCKNIPAGGIRPYHPRSVSERTPPPWLRYATAMNNDRILPGIVLMLAFCVLAPLLDTASKLATAEIPVGQITAARFLVQGALMAPIALFMRLPLAISPRIASTRIWTSFRGRSPACVICRHSAEP